VAYDERLAERVRDVLAPYGDAITERKMFGGLAFLHDGNMCVGLLGDELMVRVGPDAYDAALARPGARPMDFTGRPMRGLVMVASDAVAHYRSLRAWVERGLTFTSRLPPKTGGTTRRRRPAPTHPRGRARNR
jgi:TfoX/Sxy family transcriptional regulator of competence genes